MFGPIRIVMAAAILVSSASSVASASPTVGNQPFMYQPLFAGVFGHTPPRPPVPTHRVTFADVMRARAGGWQQVIAPAPFGNNGAGTELLMTDGSVMVQDNDTKWYRLIPDRNGNYV